MTTEEISWLIATVWVIASTIIVLRLRVFQARSLEHVPARVGTLSLASVGAVVLVYIGCLLAALGIARGQGAFRVAEPRAAAAATSGGYGTLPASTLPASMAATHPAARTASEADLPTLVLTQALDAAAKLIAAGLGLFLVSRLVVGGLDAWGVTPRHIPRGLVLGVGAYLVAIPFIYLTNGAVTDFLQRFLHEKMPPHATITALQTHPSPGLKVGLIFFAAIAAPLLEEIFFRGLLQTTLLEEGWGFLTPPKPNPLYHATPARRWVAILLTSVLFAAVHGSPEQAAVLFVLSLALGYSYERTNNLWVPITFHATFNMVNILVVLSGVK